MNTIAPQVSVVVPCYMEESVLPIMLDRLTRVVSQSLASYEIILVNDGSADDTWKVICAAIEANPFIVGVDLSRNHGHQIALSAGLQISAGERILIIDADLQDPPELFVQMNELMTRSGADVVYGRRNSRKGESWLKLSTASLFYRVLSWFSDVQIPEDTGDFRLMSRKALNVLISMPEKSRFIRGMVSWIGFKQVAFYYDREERAAGHTRYTFRKMLNLAVDAITSFSVKPLRIATYLGICIAFISFCGIAYVVGVVLLGFSDTVKGWASIIVLILLMSGIQLTVLGIIGEYLGRIFLESKNRPLFVISDIQRKQAMPHSEQK